MRANRTDANHKEIVAAFRDLNWYVLDISSLKNCCDLMVSKRGLTVAIEIKDGKKSKSQRKLTEGEEKFRDSWLGDYVIIESLDDVIKLNGEVK